MSGRAEKELTTLKKYEEGWTREMMTYWKERILRMKVYDKGGLYRSFQGTVQRGAVTTLQHRFYLYGIYVAAGVGNGYRRGNGGDLEFLKDWKTNNHHRQKRDWFSMKYYSSVMKLGEFEAAYYGKAYNGLMASALSDMFGGRGAVRNL